MIAVLMPCLFLCNTCAHAELRKQERARKLCSATLQTVVIVMNDDNTVYIAKRIKQPI